MLELALGLELAQVLELVLLSYIVLTTDGRDPLVSSWPAIDIAIVVVDITS